MNDFVNYETRERIAYLTLNRDEKRNSLNPEMILSLKEALSKAEADNDAKVIVIKSNGSVFSAGADLEHLQKLQSNTYQENLADSELLAGLFYQIYHHKKIIIAQVSGAAIAGGCGLATVCDFVFATADSKFGYTEVRIGFVPAIVMIFLLRKVGESIAKELLLTGKLIDASTAKDFGLVNEIFSSDEIEIRVKEFALKLCSTASKQSLSTTKQMIATVQSMSINEALKYASQMNATARATDDCRRGIAAFLNKENISW